MNVFFFVSGNIWEADWDNRWILCIQRFKYKNVSALCVVRRSTDLILYIVFFGWFAVRKQTFFAIGGNKSCFILHSRSAKDSLLGTGGQQAWCDAGPTCPTRQILLNSKYLICTYLAPNVAFRHNHDMWRAMFLFLSSFIYLSCRSSFICACEALERKRVGITSAKNVTEKQGRQLKRPFCWPNFLVLRFYAFVERNVAVCHVSWRRKAAAISWTFLVAPACSMPVIRFPLHAIVFYLWMWGIVGFFPLLLKYTSRLG